ncbi:MAG: putative transcriptional regulator, partial [Gammaproteobacteria bacterium]
AMSTSLGTVDANATVNEALEIMRERSSGVLVVDKRQENDEYGGLLCSDIAREVLSKDRAPARVNVYEIMRKPVVCVRPEMDIQLCSRLFDDYGLIRAPVIEGSTLIGTVSPQPGRSTRTIRNRARGQASAALRARRTCAIACWPRTLIAPCQISIARRAIDHKPPPLPDTQRLK